ncbi:MAG: arginine--tRNA ligase [Nanoarchaeota archaeon]|nr:arginine--tRNA ligase [Nanoarchaeota archaeon]
MVDSKKEIVAELLSKEVNLSKEDVFKLLEKPKYSNLGDISFPCFVLASIYKKNPFMVAQEVASRFEFAPEGFSKVQAIGGYVNFFYNNSMLAKQVLESILYKKKKYGSSKIGKGKKIIIDYSSPNIAKPMSIGHLRSTIIGNSLYKIFSFQGYSCIGINYLGDYGTQFGKMLCAYDKWGKPLEEEMKKKPIETMLGLYVKFTEESEKNPALEDEARAWFKKMEDGDKKALELWKTFRDLSIGDFKKFYDLLGVEFDVYSGESQFKEKAKLVIERLKAQKIAVESEGAWLVPFGKDEAPLLIQKNDGASLYATRDIAAAEEHFKKYKFYRKIYVVGTEQNIHFNHLFSTLQRMGYPWAKNCVHVGFGMIYLPEGKISTRKGNLVFLEDVLQRIFELTREFIDKDPKFSKKEKEKIAKAVGISALIYGDLSNDRVKDIKFDWNRLLRLEGDSGPYIQYTYARASSIMKKEKVLQKLSSIPNMTKDEETLIKDLDSFPEVVENAAEHYSSHIIANYLLRTADHFSTFYEKCPVLTAEKEVKAFRLHLTKAFAQVMENGMLLLGMVPLKRM